VTAIAIDARAAAEVPAGRGRYVRELLTALARLDGDDRWLLQCRTRKELPLGERFAWQRIGAPDPVWHLLAAGAATHHCASLLSTNSYLTAWFARVPTALVVHDMVAFAQPDWAQPRAGRIERATLGPATRRAAAFICVSEATRADLVERYPVTASRAIVIPHAASEAFSPAAASPETLRRLELERPFVLAVGTLEPRKNLERLIDAWMALPEPARADHELVLVGPRGWQEEAILARAATGGVRIPGFVSDADLAALYASCTVFAYPSLYEGFGLPVLEAMRCGAPTLTSNVSSLPEVAADAAVLVDPYDTEAIREALAELLGSSARREALRQRGIERARSFSWERTASGVRDLMRGLS
jgi:glycosyltransferase involved in cell wall biosynthesis